MIRSIAVMLLIAMAVGARPAAVRPSFATTTEEPVEESTYMTMQEGTITVDIDSDLILITSPEGESFTEPNPIELTEEPLPDSVIQQLERERAEEERARNPKTPEPDTDSETETEPPTTTEQSKLPTTTTKRSFKFGATTLPPILTTTLKPEAFTTQNYRSEDTTEYEEAKTVRNFFGRQSDLDMAENRMQTTTDAPVQDQKTDSTSSPVQGEIFMAMTTDASLVEEQARPRGEAEPGESPLFRFFSTNSKVPVTTEALPETTTVLPEAKEAEVTILPVVKESTEVPLPSTQAPESITGAAETTTVPDPSTTIATEPAPITARMELYLNAQPVSMSISSVPKTTTSTTSAPETTTSTTSAPETTISSSSAPETTTSTTSAPETTVSTYSAPETTTSTTSAPEATTSTTSAPETTTSTTKAPQTTTSTTSSTTSTTSTTPAPTTTTTTPRAVLTRAPRVERIFNSDGVEVLYGYSSVVRTNRS